MNKTQARIAAEIMDMAAEQYSNHSCNDYLIENTPENYEFVREMFVHLGWNTDPHDFITRDGRNIYLNDSQVMSYLAHLLRQ